MKAKRLWTRLEKSLVFAPFLMMLASGAVWWWQQSRVVIEVTDSSDFKSLEFSPDSSRLAVFFENSKRNRILGRVYDLHTRQKICDLETPTIHGLTPNPLSDIGSNGNPYFDWPSWSPDGTRIVAGYSDNSRGTTKTPNLFRHDKTSPKFSWNSVGKMVVWDATTGNVRGNWLYAPLNEESGGRVYFARDGKTLIGAGKPPSIFDAETGERLRVVDHGFKDAFETQENPKLGLLTVQNTHLDTLKVIDAKHHRLIWQPQKMHTFYSQWCGNVLGIQGQTYNPLNRNGTWESLFVLWDGKTRSLLSVLTAKGLNHLSLSPDEHTMAYLSDSVSGLDSWTKKPLKTLAVWDYRNAREIWRYPLASSDNGVDIQWSPNGKWLAIMPAISDTSLIRLLIFDCNGNVRLEKKGARTYISSMRWSPDSEHLAFANESAIEIVSVPRE